MSRTFLGFDFGLRRIGVAVGSELMGEARPLLTVANRDSGPDWPAIDGLVKEWGPAAFIVGVPYNADRSDSDITTAATAFSVTLGERFDLPVHLVDERLSSFAANEALVERRQRGDHRRVKQGEIDAAAAAVILNDWLGGGETR